MRGKLFLAVLLVLSVIGFASAVQTTINIQTYPSHTVYVTPIEPTDGFEAMSAPVSGFTSVYGKKQIILDLDENYFHLYIVVKDGDERVYYKKFEDQTYELGGIYNLVVLPPGVEPVKKPNVTNIIVETENVSEENSSNQTETNTTEENITDEQNTNETTSPENQDVITGFASKEIKFTGKTLLYALGIIVLLAILFVAYRYVRRFNKANPPKKEIKIRKLSEVHEEKKGQVDEQIKKIEEAKRMIQDAEHEIRRIKNPNFDKIEAAKKKLIEDQKELMKLRNEAREAGKALDEMKKATPSEPTQPPTQPSNNN